MIHNLKLKFDKILDDIFFSNDFKYYILEKTGYCPTGLTIDTYVENDKPEFICRCKEYGFDFSGERIIGDYNIIKPNVDLEKYGEYMIEYLHTNHPSVYNEITKYDIYCD